MDEMPTIVEAAARVSGTSRRRRLVRCLVTAIGAPCVWLWAVEAWFRPAWCCRVPEWVWLAGGCAAAGVVAWLGARRMAIGLLAGLPLARWVAVWISAFVIRADFAHAPAGDSASNGGMDFDPESQLDRWLGSGPVVRNALTFYLGLEDNAGLPSGFELVACSRPATRRKFISLSLRRPDAVRGFAYGGARLFACSVGADVDLGFRRDLAADLLGLLESQASRPDTKAMAAMWLGLVFLSDPAEFGHLRFPARDGMLACEDPPYSRFGDQWMRTLDCLMVYDPPGSWDALAAGFARNPGLLSRAVRERVRGTLVSLDAIQQETDRRTSGGELEAAIVLWVETGRLLSAWPDDPRRAEVEAWRRKVLSRWLADDRLGNDETFDGEFEQLGRLPEDPLVQPDPSGREAAFRKALELLEPLADGGTVPGDSAEYWRMHRRVGLANRLLDYLDPDQRRRVVRLAAGFWVKPCPVSDGTNRSRFDWCYDCRNMLFTHWSELEDPHRRMAVESIRAHWQQTGQTGVTVRTPYFAREAGFLDEVEWLLTALVGYPDGPLDPNAPPPGLGMPARTKMAAALESGVAKARAADPGAWNTVVIDGLRTCHGGRPFPKMLETSLLQQLPGRKQMANCGFDGLEWIRKLLEKRLPSMFPGAEATPAVKAWTSPASIRHALALCFGHGPPELTEVLDEAERNPPATAILAAAWNDLTLRSRQGPVLARARAFGGLFRLAARMPDTERSAMREAFLGFFRTHLLARHDWPGWLLESATTPASARGGVGVPWENDPLSAALSWWSGIGEETYPTRQRDAVAMSRGSFSYIAQAYMDFEAFSGRRGAPGLGQAIRARAWPRNPPVEPFPPTPWQRARALHRTHPDLRFPDRNPPRPRTGFTIAW